MTTRAHQFATDVIANADSGVGTQWAGTDVAELARAYLASQSMLALIVLECELAGDLKSLNAAFHIANIKAMAESGISGGGQ